MTVTKVQIMGNATNGVKPMQRDVTKMVPSVTRRCLFGAPSQASLDKIWNRTLENERQRMLTTYGFDVKTEKLVNNRPTAGSSFTSKQTNKNISRSPGSFECNNMNLNSKQLEKSRSQRQTHLTDYYSSTKMKTQIKGDKVNAYKNEKKNSVTKNKQ